MGEREDRKEKGLADKTEETAGRECKTDERAGRSVE